MTEPQIIAKPICRKCGSDDVACDASARWDVTAQKWVMSGVMDDVTCEACGYDTSNPAFAVWTGDQKGEWTEDSDTYNPLTDKARAVLNAPGVVLPEFARPPEPASA